MPTISTSRWDSGDDFDAAATDLYALLGDINHAPVSRRDLADAMDYLLERVAEEDRPGVHLEAAWQFSELAYHLRGKDFEAPPLPPGNPWVEVKDGDPRLLMLFHDHYTYRPPKGQRKNKLVVGPGYKLPLLIPHAGDPLHGRPQAIFAWRLERYRSDSDYGACCVFFRNESKFLASHLILAAEAHAMRRWPYIPRFFSHIDTTKVRPMMRRGQPTWGYCYIKAGWRVLPQRTGRNALLRLEKTITPLGWLDTWESLGRAHHDGPFPVRRYLERHPANGGRPRMAKAQRRRQPLRFSVCAGQLPLL
jgi:hypothetical protein